MSVRENPLIGNLPNGITVARILAVPLFVWLVLDDKLAAAFWVFVLAGLSDALDGFVAKRFGLVTSLGRYLDPIADKALLVTAYVVLGEAGYVPLWLVILVVFRDVLIIGGTILFHTIGRPVEMRPLFVSKVNTFVQIVLIAGVLARFGIGAPDILPVLVYVVAVTTVVSGLAYMCRWVFGIRAPARWPSAVRSSRHVEGRS